uniref:Uncharacterized protein n=1 Tax=Caenorhabditis japonica TaxID=281687 RepID=A0A8R1I7Z3_CAEJA
MDETQLLVIRHVAPNPGIPPPRKDYPARRPSYKTSLSLRNGKDLEWSTVMAAIKNDENSKEFEWKNEDLVMVLKAQQITKSQLIDGLESRRLNLDAKFNEKIPEENIENLMGLEHPSKDLEALVNLFVPWYIGKTLTLYEGPLDYPDSSRLSQIVAKHSVNCLLSTTTFSARIPNPEYLKFFKTPTLKFSEISIPNFKFL